MKTFRQSFGNVGLLKECEKLERLNIDDSMITDDELMACVREVKSIKYLSIQGTNLLISHRRLFVANRYINRLFAVAIIPLRLPTKISHYISNQYYQQFKNIIAALKVIQAQLREVACVSINLRLYIITILTYLPYLRTPFTG